MGSEGDESRSGGRSSPTGCRVGAGRNRVGLGLLCVLLCASAGCSGQSTFLTGGPSVGQLKTSLSHLEFENEQLKKKTAKLERENRSMEDRLVQEQIDNGDLTARLDDARNLLRDRGVTSDVRLGSRRRGEADDTSSEDEGSRTRTVPTGRATRQRRKAPFAQISGTTSSSSSTPDEEDSPSGSRKKRNPKTDRSSGPFDDAPDHHSFHPGTLEWLPVAASPRIRRFRFADRVELD